MMMEITIRRKRKYISETIECASAFGLPLGFRCICVFVVGREFSTQNTAVV